MMKELLVRSDKSILQRPTSTFKSSPQVGQAKLMNSISVMQLSVITVNETPPQSNMNYLFFMFITFHCFLEEHILYN